MAQRKRFSPVTPIAISPEDCTPDIKKRIVSDLPFLEDLSETEILDVMPLFREQGFVPGETIAPEQLCVVGAGLVKIIRSDYDGREIVLDFLRTGEFFGLAVGSAAEDRAQAHTAACVFAVNGDAVRRLFLQYPSVTAHMLASTAERVNELHRRLQFLSGADVSSRVIETLSRLAEKTGSATADGTLLQLPLSREDLGSLSGATTESVSRVVSELSRNGYLKTGRRWFTLRPKFADLLDRDHSSR